MIPWDIILALPMGLIGLVILFVSGAYGSGLLDSGEPATLPPWTGRERESLQHDFEAASKEEIPPWASCDKIIPRAAERHGLFPEALQMYLESDK